MKTALAVQVFSKSVADSLDYCRKILKLEAFKGSDATSKFLRTFNNIFDVLNSKSKFGKGLKGPLTKSNGDFKDVFNTAEHYIRNLKLPNGKFILEIPRNRAFVGLLALMKSVSYMFDVYVCTNHLSYLLTFKLSQDHLGRKNFQFMILLNGLHDIFISQ